MAAAAISHYNVILIVTSFATELATPTATDERNVTDTLPRLIYKDDVMCTWSCVYVECC